MSTTPVSNNASSFSAQLQGASRYVQRYISLDGRLWDVNFDEAKRAHEGLVRDVIKPNGLSEQYAATLSIEAVSMKLSLQKRAELLRPLREALDAQAKRALGHPITTEFLERAQLTTGVVRTAHMYNLLSDDPARELIEGISLFLENEDARMVKRAEGYEELNFSYIACDDKSCWGHVSINGVQPKALVIESRVELAPVTSVRKDLALVITFTPAVSVEVQDEVDQEMPRVTLRIDERVPVFAQLNNRKSLRYYLDEMLKGFCRDVADFYDCYLVTPPLNATRFKARLEEAIYMMFENEIFDDYDGSPFTGITVE